MDSGIRVAVSDALCSQDSKSTMKLGGLKRGAAVLMMGFILKVPSRKA